MVNVHPARRCFSPHCIGRARHPGPASRGTPGFLSVEFANIGGWLTHGDVALDSCAQFLAVAEHRLIPTRVRSVGHQLRVAGFLSVWAPACQDHIVGGHAGVGVVSLVGAPLAAPPLVTPGFREFHRLDRAMTGSLFLLVMVGRRRGSFTFLSSMVIKGLKRIRTSFCSLCTLRLRLCVWDSLCLV